MASAVCRGVPRGSATAATAQTGTAAIAATSDRLRTIAFRPAAPGPCWSRRKCTPSSTWSVATSTRCRPQATTAMSSPGPTGTQEGSR